MAAGLKGTSGFAATPTITLDLPLVQRLQRSPRFRVRVPSASGVTIAASPRAEPTNKGNLLHSERQHVARRPRTQIMALTR